MTVEVRIHADRWGAVSGLLGSPAAGRHSADRAAAAYAEDAARGLQYALDTLERAAAAA